MAPLNDSLHIGFIPDGNRRWCAQRGADAHALVAHHLATLCGVIRDVLCSHAAACELFARIRKLSMYMLSIDNLQKRRDESTLVMVSGVLEGLFWLALAASVCRELIVKDLRQKSSDETPSSSTPKNADDEKRSKRSVGVVCHPALKDASCGGDGLTRRIVVSVDFDGAVASGPAWPDLQPCIDTVRQMAEATLGCALRVYLTDSLMQHVPVAMRDALKGLAFSSSTSGTSLLLHLQTSAEADAHTRSIMSEQSLVLHVACSDPTNVDSCVVMFDSLQQLSCTRVDFTGELDLLPARARDLARGVERVTASAFASVPPRLLVCLALAYDPLKDISRKVESSTVDPIDLVIRTSGEKRTSGFFPIETLYSEWIFHPKLFPDFRMGDLTQALAEYSMRDRRYGA